MDEKYKCSLGYIGSKYSLLDFINYVYINKYLG